MTQSKPYPDEHQWMVQAQQSSGGWIRFGRPTTLDAAHAHQTEIESKLNRPVRIVQITQSYRLMSPSPSA